MYKESDGSIYSHNMTLKCVENAESDEILGILDVALQLRRDTADPWLNKRMDFGRIESKGPEKCGAKNDKCQSQ